MAIIETADPLLVDCMLNGDGEHAELYHAIAERTWASGMDKANVSKEVFDAIFMQIHHAQFFAGGSTFNTLHAVTHAFGEGVHPIRHYAAIGLDIYGKFLEEICTRDRYTLKPDFPDSQRALIDTPRSLVFHFTKHMTGRKIATYRGNVRDYITAQTITDEPSDYIYLNGNGLSNYTGAFSALRRKALHRKTPILFSLPTRSRITQENFQECLDIVSIAHVVLGNEEELGYLFNGQTRDDNIKQLQSILAKNTQISAAFPCCALITTAKAGAIAITKEASFTIPAMPMTKPFVSNVGAGDNAYAGFICGLLSNRTVEESGQVAMVFAADCMTRMEAQIPNPEHVLKTALSLQA
jgi:sugar/nucleoside kinase (ribokinase family)